MKMLGEIEVEVSLDEKDKQELFADFVTKEEFDKKIEELYDMINKLEQPEEPKPEPEEPKPEPEPEQPEVDSNPTLKLEYNFENSNRGSADGTIVLSSTDSKNDGTYAVYWGNKNGKIPEYQRIASLKMSGKSTKTYDFVSLNAIPENADRIILTKDGSEEKLKEVKIDDSKLIKQNKKFCFGALSDVHLNADGKDESKSFSDFDSEIAYFKEKGVAVICTSGDITRNGTEADAKAVIKKRDSMGIPFYNARGNHDCMSYCGSNWSKVEPNGKTFYKEINGEVFAFLGLNKKDDYSNPFSDADIEELKGIFKQFEGKRIFLFEHYFVGTVGNVSNLYPYGKMSDSGTSKKFKDLLKANKNVITFTGHSHLHFELQRINEFANVKGKTENYGPRVHIPSGSRPRRNDESTSDTASNTYTYHNGAMGYLVDVYDGFIVLKGRDFVKNTNLPYATYIIETE